ncbi:unnamed protein product [Ixodes persulcatus]
MTKQLVNNTCCARVKFYVTWRSRRSTLTTSVSSIGERGKRPTIGCHLAHIEEPSGVPTGNRGEDRTLLRFTLRWTRARRLACGALPRKSSHLVWERVRERNSDNRSSLCPIACRWYLIHWVVASRRPSRGLNKQTKHWPPHERALAHRYV